MSSMCRFSRTDECVTIGRCKISRLLFADCLVLLTSSESGFQYALNSFAAACDNTGMKISTSKAEVLSREILFNCKLWSIIEISKYFGVAFTSDGNHDAELNVRSSKTSAVMRALHHFVVLKRELSRKAKLLYLNQYSSRFPPMVLSFR